MAWIRFRPAEDGHEISVRHDRILYLLVVVDGHTTGLVIQGQDQPVVVQGSLAQVQDHIETTEFYVRHGTTPKAPPLAGLQPA